MRYAARPCAPTPDGDPGCPWRRDQPPGAFPAERYEALRCTSAGPDGSAPLGAPLFACHKTAEGKEIACAGWLAVEGLGHVTVRLALAQDELSPDAVEPQPGWPDLVDSYDELARINGASGG